MEHLTFREDYIFLFLRDFTVRLETRVLFRLWAPLNFI